MYKLSRRFVYNYAIKAFHDIFTLQNQTYSLSAAFTPLKLIKSDDVRITQSISLILSVTKTSEKYIKGRSSEFYPIRTAEMLQLANCDMSNSNFEMVKDNKAVIFRAKEKDLVEIIIYVKIVLCRIKVFNKIQEKYFQQQKVTSEDSKKQFEEVLRILHIQDYPTIEILIDKISTFQNQ